MSCTGTIVSTVKNLVVFFACVYVRIADTSTIETSTFARSAHCPGKVPTWGSRYQTSEARSLVECVGMCRLTNACLSVMFDAVNESCHLSNRKASEDCSNMIPAMTGNKYYEKRIAGEDVESPANTSYTCSQCNDANCPDMCTVMRDMYVRVLQVEDCLDLAKYGSMTTSGTYWIKPSGALEPFRVYCKFRKSTIQMQILSRIDMTVDFNRTWLEYRDGFGEVGDMTTTYWLGLKKIHYLVSSKTYRLKIRVILDFNSTAFDVNHDNVVLNNETEGYSIAFSGKISGALGNCLGDLQDVRFSTYDVDNDGSDNVNCALQHGGGWWFKGDSCSTCNPFGPILSPYDGVRKGVMGESFWINNLGDLVPFTVSMFLTDI